MARPKKARVLIRRTDPIRWTKADAETLRNFAKTETWRKFRCIVEDSTVQKLLDEARNQRTAGELEAFVAGRLSTLTSWEEHCGERQEEQAEAGKGDTTILPDWDQR